MVGQRACARNFLDRASKAAAPLTQTEVSSQPPVISASGIPLLRFLCLLAANLMLRLSGIFIYPVKSCRGFALPAAEVDALGFAGDRRFLVVDESGRFLTQRSHPRMALIATALTDESLTLTANGHGSVATPRTSPAGARTVSVTVWKSENLLADDCGDEAADWLGSFLSTRCRLVRIGEKFRRPVLKKAARPGDQVDFADAVPFLLISQSSLDDLNDRLVAKGEDALPVDRFRPNLVVTGSAPYAEDGWSRLRIGPIAFRNAGPCSRCIVTTTDQETAVRGKEPLRTFATYRRDPDNHTDVNFGANLIHESHAGRLSIGDAVEVLPS